MSPQESAAAPEVAVAEDPVKVQNARVLVLLHAGVLQPDMVRDTLNVLLKFESDIEAAGKQIDGMTHKARKEAGLVE